MPLPRVRFTVRRLMIAVAVVAVLLGGELLRRKRADRLERLAWLAGRERMLLANRHDPSLEIAAGNLKHGKPMGVEEALQEIAKQRRRFEYAAAHPWLPVPPDPE